MSHWQVPRKGSVRSVQWAVLTRDDTYEPKSSEAAARRSVKWLTELDVGMTPQLANRLIVTASGANGGTWVYTGPWQVVEEAKP